MLSNISGLTLLDNDRTICLHRSEQRTGAAGEMVSATRLKPNPGGLKEAADLSASHRNIWQSFLQFSRVHTLFSWWKFKHFFNNFKENCQNFPALNFRALYLCAPFSTEPYNHGIHSIPCVKAAYGQCKILWKWINSASYNINTDMILSCQELSGTKRSDHRARI